MKQTWRNPIMKKAIVRITKTGRIVWADAETKNKEIAAQLILEGYTLQMTPEELGKVKYLVVNSNPTCPKQIYNGLETKKQKEQFLEEWNRYDHLDDRIRIITKSSVEYNTLRRILGPVQTWY